MSSALDPCLVVEQALARIAAIDGKVHAFTTITAERARLEAREVTRRFQSGEHLPLAGLTYTVKNLFDLQGVVTVAGSKARLGALPAEADGPLVCRLQDAGAICLGAVNMGEFAYDFVTENLHFGATRNPRDLQRSAGGSSGGSGAAVAAGLGDVSLGSDTNGSIRVPASFCGVFGLKPTYGRLGRSGTFPFVASLDHLGPLARRVEHLASVYDVLQGPDAGDAAWCGRPVEPSLPELDTPLSAVRVAKLGGYFAEGGDPVVHEAVERVAAALGAERVVEWAEAPLARAAGYLITAMEAGSLHRTRLLEQAQNFEPITRDRLLAGLAMPGNWYAHAQRFRRWWWERVCTTFANTDVLLAPATPVTATELGQPTISFRGETLSTRPNLGVFTQPISLAGLPVVAVPLTTSRGLPCAVQLIGAPWTEALLLRVARHLEALGVTDASLAETSLHHSSP